MCSQANIQGVFNERVEHLDKFRRLMGDRLLEHHLIAQDAEVVLLARSFDIYGDISSVSPFKVDGPSVPLGVTSEGVYYLTDSKGRFIHVILFGGRKQLAVWNPELRVSYLIDSQGRYIHVRGEKVVVNPFVKRVLLDKTPDMSYVQKTFANYLVENSENYPYFVQMTMTDMPRHLNLGDRLRLGETVYEVRLVSPVSRLNDSIQKVMVCPVLFSDVPEQATVDPPFVPVEDDRYKKSVIL
jgi:hypothetical protein